MLTFIPGFGSQPCPMCGDNLVKTSDSVYCNSCGFPIEVDAE